MAAMTESKIENPKSKIGLVAGWGRYPLVVAQALKAKGYEVHCVGLKNHVDAALRDVCDSFAIHGVARMGSQIRFFRRRGITQATMAGKVFKHKVLFGRLGWLSLIPDFTTIRAFFPFFVLGQKDRNDDTLLTVVVDSFARSGITMSPATDF